MRCILVIVAMAGVAASGASFAQSAVPPSPKGYAGELIAVSGDMVQLKSKDGATVSLTMTPGWTVSTARPARIEDIGVGDFIASANADIDATHGKANELRILEAGYRPEYGTHPIGKPQTSMTHGFVFARRKAGDDAELDIAYPDGRRTLQVPKQTSVTVYDLHERAFAAPGVQVSTVTRPGADGVARASRLVVEQRNSQEK